MLPGRSDCHDPNHTDHTDDCLTPYQKIRLNLWTNEDRFRPVPEWVPPDLLDLIKRRGHADVKLRTQWP